MSMTDTVAELQKQCEKHGLDKKYRLKQDLVDRLEEFFDNAFDATPSKKFFLFLRDNWKQKKKDTMY